MMNVRFEYLYRDAGNFKLWGEVVFSNPGNIGQDTLAAVSGLSLPLDRLYFLPDQMSIPSLRFDIPIANLDHEWHEVHSFELCDEMPNDPQARDVGVFMQSLFRCAASLGRKVDLDGYCRSLYPYKTGARDG